MCGVQCSTERLVCTVVPRIIKMNNVSPDELQVGLFLEKLGIKIAYLEKTLKLVNSKASRVTSTTEG